MVLEKCIYRLCDCLKDKKEEFDELDYDLKLDGTFRPGGILATVNSCRIFQGLSLFSKRDIQFVACTKHSQGIHLFLGTRMKNIQWDGPRRDVCLHAMDFICTFLMTWGEGSGRVAYNTIISCPINPCGLFNGQMGQADLMAVFCIALICHCQTGGWNSWRAGENGPGLY